MFVRRIAGLGAAAMAVAVVFTGVNAAPAAAAAAPPRTIYYDDSRAAQWKPNVVEAVQIWNTTVKNVRLAPAGPGTPRATVRLMAENGWPYCGPCNLGRGDLHLGEDAVRQGHDRTRITAHEIGHILGLPDRRTGRCSDLMSGGSAPASCKNAHPNPAEAAEVERNFQNGLTAASVSVAHGHKYEECFPAAVHA